LRSERERLGLSQTELGVFGGVGKQSQTNYETGKRIPDVEYVSGIAQAGADIVYILTGERSAVSLPANMADWMARSMALDMAKDLDSPPSDFVELPLHDVELAAGHGADNGSETLAEELAERLAFRRSWLKRIGVATANAVLARAKGDSMLPGIHDGDLLLIDTARRDLAVRPRGPTDLRPAQIYALLDGDQARIKRLERPEPGVVMLVSDNPAFPPEVITGAKIDALNIIGKVMWWGHTNVD
jgi:phage repressor protein C with HTH and peptisase S24 domain